MDNTSKILQNMKEGCFYRPEDLYHLGIAPGQIQTILKHLAKGGIIDSLDEGFRKRKVYKTRQKSLLDAAPQNIIDNSAYSTDELLGEG